MSMTDVLKKKLVFPSVFVKLQAVDEVLSLAKKSLKSRKKNCEELDILWKNCSEPPSAEIGYACSNAVIALVKEGLIDVQEAITSAVNHASSATDMTFLVHVIGNLVNFEVTSTDHKIEDSCRCLYKFRDPPHPFISVLGNGGKSCDVVSAHMSHMILDCEETHLPIMLEAIRPAILYVALSASKMPAQYSLKPHAVVKALLLRHAELPPNISARFSIQELLRHILDYWEPNADNTGIFEQIGLMASSDFKIDRTVLVLKLQSSMLVNQRSYDQSLALKSIDFMLLQCEGFNLDLNIILLGFTEILANAPLQILDGILKSLLFLLGKLTDPRPVYLHLLKVLLLKIQFLNTVSPFSSKTNELLQRTFKIVQNGIKISKQETMVNAIDSPAVASSNVFVAKVYSCCFLLSKLASNRDFAFAWLNGVQDAAVTDNVNTTDVEDITLILASTFLQSLRNPVDSRDTVIPFKILDTIQTIGKAHPKVSFTLMPALLYSLNEAKSTLLIEILRSLPHIAGHPFCIAPVLSIIKAIGYNSDVNMKAMSLRLLVDLWIVQKRCFPYLLDAIDFSEVPSVKKLSNRHGIKTIKAAAIAFVCKERPHQYGADMLKQIDLLLITPSTSEALTYALDGLYSLCANKVLRLDTILKRVISLMQSHLGNSVTVKMALKILSLLSCCDMSDPNLQDIADEVLCSVWHLTSLGNTELAGQALYCLSHFDLKTFRIRHLPALLRPKMPDDITEGEFLDNAIPCLSFLHIAKSVKSINSPGGVAILTSTLRQELLDLPRGIHYKALKSHMLSTQPKVAKTIPEFISAAYERNKKPSLRAPLAFSLLLSFNLSLESGVKDNTAVKLSITSGRKCMDTLQALLKEVSIEPNNWQDLLRCAFGWVTYVKKILRIMIAGRCAEVELQKVDDEEEKCHRINTASLWCRDKIVNVLKSASKGSPNMQGNAIFALTGLIVAVGQLEDDSPKHAADVHTEYVSMSHWSLMVLDTIICVAFPNYTPSGRLLSWCQYRAISSTGRLCTTQVGRLCAIYALQFCVSTSASRNHRKVKDILTLLMLDKCDEKQIDWHCSISLGNILNALTRENTADSLYAESDSLVQECFEMLCTKVEKSLECRFSGLQDNLGCVIGWCFAISSKLSQVNVEDFERHKHIWNQLLQILKSEDMSPDSSQTVSGVLTWFCLHGISSGVISSTDIDSLVNALVDITTEDPSKSGFADSLGTLCCGLLLSGNRHYSTTADKLYSNWFATVEKDNVPTREKFAALNGLSALCGSTAALIFLPVDPAMLTAITYATKLSAVVKLLKHLHNSSDTGIQARASAYLSGLSMFFESNIHNSTFVLPSAYDYLPKNSLLRGLFSTLADYAQQHMENEYIRTTLHCLASGSHGFTLPPVNWANALNPVLFTRSVDESTKNSAVTFVLSQCENSSSCACLISKCIRPEVYDSLPITSRSSICENLDKVARTVKEHEFGLFLKHAMKLCIHAASMDKDLQLKIAAIAGLENASQTCDRLSASVQKLIHEISTQVLLGSSLTIYMSADVVTMGKIAHIFAKDKVILELISKKADGTPAFLLKSSFIACYNMIESEWPPSACVKQILQSDKFLEAHSEFLWIVALCTMHIKRRLTASAFGDWLNELLRMIKGRVDVHSVSRTSLEHFFAIVSITVTIWSPLHSYLPAIGDFNASPVSPDVMNAFVGMCRTFFPLAVLKVTQERRVGALESLFNWLVCMAGKCKQSFPESEWLDTLICAIGMCKQDEGKLPPSMWCEMVSTMYGVG